MCYERSGTIFQQVRNEGGLRSRFEPPGRSFKKPEDVHVHVGRDGLPLFGPDGIRRLAIAQVLGLTRIPAQLRVVHRDALPGTLTSESQIPFVHDDLARRL